MLLKKRMQGKIRSKVAKEGMVKVEGMFKVENIIFLGLPELTF